jgi:hypothetical protein
MDGPCMLASFVQGSLSAIDELDADLGRQVRAAMKPDTLEELESASRVSWIPLHIDIELTECFFEVAGEERAFQALRDNLANALDSTVLKPLLDGAFAIFGRSPAKILRWTPKVWSLLYRNCGELSLAKSDDHSAVLEATDLPPELVANANYMKGTAAAILGFFQVLGVDAECKLQGQMGNSTTLLVTWKS